METRNDILDELRSWGSPLADIPRTMPFEVPKDYFESFITQAVENIQEPGRDYPIPVSKEMPYEVPQGYFENLPVQMLALAGEEPMLSLTKVLPFEVPEGYFEQLPEQILKATRQSEKSKTKIIPLGGRIERSLRWAAAAILLLAIGIGTYRVLNPAVNFDPARELAQLPAGEIGTYVEQHIDEFDTEMLENSVASATGIQSLSEEEIINYLDETGWNTTVTN